MSTCLAMLSPTVFAQQISVKVDPSVILIGEPMRLQIRIAVKESGTPFYLTWPESLLHFEKLSADSGKYVNDNGQFYFEQEIRFTSFDSGRWMLPALQMTGKVEDKPWVGYTDSLPIQVNYALMDSSGVLRDIRPIIDQEPDNYFWWYAVGGVLLALVLGLLLYRYFRKNALPRSQKSIEKQPAYEEALAALAVVKKQPIDSKAAVLAFHTSLAQIFKTYYGRRQQSNFLKQTTGDLLLMLRSDVTAPEAISLLAAPLRLSDAVKFAQYFPDQTTSQECLDQIKEAIEKLHFSQATKVLNSDH